jgi:RNA polymerase sigma factor (sigma-70 family)
VTHNRSEAEDLTQEAFLRVFERWDQVGEMDDPTAYLYRTAMNAFRTWHRRVLLGAKRSVGLSPSDDRIAEIETEDAVVRTLAPLTPRQRAAVVLIDLLGYSSEEAGRMLGLAPYQWSDLPEGAWADHLSKPFVPSKYGVCYTLSGESDWVPGTTVLRFFPARARDILRGKDHTNRNVPCSEVTTDEARTLLNILGTMVTADIASYPDYPTPDVRLGDSDGDLIGWAIHMVLPHGAIVPCTDCY